MLSSRSMESRKNAFRIAIVYVVGIELPLHHDLGFTPLVFVHQFSHAQHGAHAAVEERGHFLPGFFISFPKDMPALGVPDQRHGGAGLLGPDGDVGPLTQLVGQRPDGNGRREEPDGPVGLGKGQFLERSRKGGGLLWSVMHLPVGGKDGSAHDQRGAQYFKGCSQRFDLERGAAGHKWYYLVVGCV